MERHDLLRVPVDGRIKHRMRMAIPREKSLQAHHISRAGKPNQARATPASFDESDAPKNQRAHDALTEFCLGDDYCAQRWRIDQQRFNMVECASVHECRTTGE